MATSSMLSLVFLLLVAAAAGAAAQRHQHHCRCLFGDECFPSDHAWSKFNRSVGGRLIAPVPTAYFCHDPHYDEAACNETKANWADSLWRSRQAGTLELPNREAYGNETCFITSSRDTPCLQGSVPVYAVNVSSVQDVQAAVRFAGHHRLRLVVKNTGHDYNGKSTGRGALSLWMHNLQDVEFLSFQHRNNQSLDAVKIGAGVQWRDLLQAVTNRGYLAVSPLSASVGAGGGWWQGAGHGALAPTYGLGADNVLEFEVVTADGKKLIANVGQNADLFWAMRGGGGGTFGVVVSVTYAIHTAPKKVLGLTLAFAANGTSSFKDLLTEFARVHPSLTDSGWAGTFNVLRNTLYVTYVALDKEPAFFNSTWGDFTAYVESHPGISRGYGGVTTYQTYYQWYDSLLCSFYAGNLDGGQCVDRLGENRAIASRLIPRSVIEANPSTVAQMLIDVVTAPRINSRILGLSVAGGKVAHPSVDNAVNPAWRRALWHLTIGLDSTDGPSAEEQQQNQQALSAAAKIMRDVTPGSGTYVNEVDFYEPDWQQSMYGSNYQLLKVIKRARDPRGLFVCRNCVGSEDWTEDFKCSIY